MLRWIAQDALALISVAAFWFALLVWADFLSLIIVWS